MIEYKYCIHKIKILKRNKNQCSNGHVSLFVQLIKPGHTLVFY